MEHMIKKTNISMKTNHARTASVGVIEKFSSKSSISYSGSFIGNFFA